MSSFFASYCPISEPLSKASIWRVLSRVMCAKPHTRQACSSLLQHWASFSFFLTFFQWKRQAKTSFSLCLAISRLFFTYPAPKWFTKDRVVKKCQKKRLLRGEKREEKTTRKKAWYFPQSCLLHELYGKDGPFLHNGVSNIFAFPLALPPQIKKWIRGLLQNVLLWKKT